jgi:hypothetical protein
MGLNWDSDSAIFCFGKENLNSYEENETRKVSAKVHLALTLRSAQNRRKTICANKGLCRP